MAKTYFTIEYSEIDYLLEKFEHLTDKETLKKIIKRELERIYNDFQPQWEQGWKKHNRTPQERKNSGHAHLPKVEESLLPKGVPNVKWVSDEASIKMGFSLSSNNYRGLISQFVIHGTTVNGSERAKPDKELLQLLKGSGKKKMIERLEDRLADAIVEELSK